MDHLQGAVEALQSRLGEGLVGREAFRDQICLEVAPAVLPRVKDGAVWLDLRTVFEEDEEALIRGLRKMA